MALVRGFYFAGLYRVTAERRRADARRLIWNAAMLVEAGVARSDVILHALPLYHAAQLDCLLGPAVSVGASNIVISPDRS